MTVETLFELIGHDSPSGKYPAPVVPIGRIDGKLVAVYIDSIKSEPVLEPVHEEAVFIRHDANLKNLLKDFDYRKDSLFAPTPEDVKFYVVQDEEKFFRSLLADEAFSITNPFLRLSLAEATEDFLLVYREITACENYFKEHDPETIPLWKLEKIVKVLGMTEFRALDDERFCIDKEQLSLLRQIISVESQAALKDLKKSQTKIHLQQVLRIGKWQEKTEQLERENLDLKADLQRISDLLHSLLLVDVEPLQTP